MSREEHHRMGTADLVAGTEARHDTQPRSPAGAEPPRGDAMPGAGGMRPPGDAMRPPEEPVQASMARQPQPAAADQASEPLEALFPPPMAANFRQRWDAVQIGFVDNPQEAVRQADELVAEVMKSLATSFSEQRARLESGAGGSAPDQTEHLRMALRAYRSFFERLLSL